MLISGLKQLTNEDIIKVMTGCIFFCTVRGVLITAVKKLYKHVRSFDAVLMETTELADPAPVVQNFFVGDAVKKLYRLDGIITVVGEEKSEGAENESVEQMAFADRIDLNKCDFLLTGRLQTEINYGEDCLDVESAEKVEGASWKSNGIVNEKSKDDCPLLALKDRIRGLNPHAPIIRTNFCQVDQKAWLSIPALSE